MAVAMISDRDCTIDSLVSLYYIYLQAAKMDALVVPASGAFETLLYFDYKEQ
jgi:hypothetical protein